MASFMKTKILLLLSPSGEKRQPRFDKFDNDSPLQRKNGSLRSNNKLGYANACSEKS